MNQARRHEGTEARRFRGFTLTELMIAVVVLIVVILAAARIFGTASQVTGMGQATADVMTETTTIERQIRRDIQRMSREGVLAIRNVAVRNDVNGAALLDPDLPPDATLRCDQLQFFATGIEQGQSAYQGHGANAKLQGTQAMVYYGHGYQVPDAPPFNPIDPNEGRAVDVAPTFEMTPWYAGAVPLVDTIYQTGGSGSSGHYNYSSQGDHYINQPGSKSWLLARQAIIFADDDDGAPGSGSKVVFGPFGLYRTARSVFLNDPAFSALNPQVRDSRVDAAATDFQEIRSRIINFGDWDEQRELLLDELVHYPRTERIAPSYHRMDQLLTNPVLASGCSSFIVEWTYDLGVGEAGDLAGVSNAGLGSTIVGNYEQIGETRWFGMRDVERGVYPYSSTEWPDGWTGQAGRYLLSAGGASTSPTPSRTYTIFPENIETFESPNPSVNIVNYVFGFNQEKPFLNPFTDLPDDSVGSTDEDAVYTPWPSALRITMTLHDPRGRLKAGRTVQFIVRLPERN